MTQQHTGPRRPRHHHRPGGTGEGPAGTAGPAGPGRRLDNGAVEWTAFGQVVYVRDAAKHPPGASYTIAGIIGFFCVAAIGWQCVTTYTSFFNIILSGAKWATLSKDAQAAAHVAVEVICVFIAVGFQAPLIFWAFKVDKRFAAERHKVLSFAAKISLVMHVTLEVMAANLLLSLWAAIALVADTIGDIGFLSAYTDSAIVLFFYGTSLYGLSTIGLSECLQLLWDGMVTSEWIKHVKIANALAEQKIAEAIEFLNRRTKARPQPAGGQV